MADEIHILAAWVLAGTAVAIAALGVYHIERMADAMEEAEIVVIQETLE